MNAQGRPTPTTDPFHHQPMPVSHPPQARQVEAERQGKPWGSEVVFADGGNGYVGKLLCIDAGKRLSLQRHRAKDETLVVLEGQVRLETGSTPDQLAVIPLAAGDAVHLPPGALHRFEAVTDCVLVEVSTAFQGWRHDVVRLADDFGREGTSNP
jgi:quercetin dioxygenase-like cupin family protein